VISSSCCADDGIGFACCTIGIVENFVAGAGMSIISANPSGEQAQAELSSDEGGGHFSINVGDAERKASLVSGGLLALLGLSRRSPGGLLLAAVGGGLLYRGLTGHCPAYGVAGVSTASADDPVSPEKFQKRGVHVVASFTVDKPRAELFRYWRDFNNLPRFMTHLKSVRVIDDKRSHWVAQGPAGVSLAWDAELINEEPDSLIAWRSLQGGDVDSAGSVRFLDAPPGRGSEVKVVLDYIPPAGKFGAALSWLLGHGGDTTVREDLRRFKQIMEAGEVPTIEGQPSGRKSKAE
jgi:uncharacterized membrane protein